MGGKGDTFMSMKKLSLKKETLLPMNDDQAQTIAGGLPIGTSVQPAANGALICGGTFDTCRTDCSPCGGTATCATNCGTCATCATNCGTCGTCATNCGTCVNCTTDTVAKTCDTCRTDCVCGTVQPANGGRMICAQF
jgi:hypothetical protein